MKTRRIDFRLFTALRWLLLALTVALMAPNLSAAPTTDEEEAKPIEAELLAELKSLEEKLAKVEDLQANITQSKHVALLKKPLVSLGTIKVKGERMRWDITNPSASTTITSASEIRIHYPQQKIVEVYRVDQRVASVIASPVPQLAVLTKHFHIERLATPKGADASKQLDIRLVPRSDELKKHIERVNVSIDRLSAFVRQMEMVDVDGDRTVISFEEIETNIGLKSSDFDLQLPAGTHIIHPLEGAKKSSP